MPGCVLRAGGDSFDVEAFLAESTWAPLATFSKGETTAGRYRELAGFNVLVSDASGGEFSAQVMDAMAFLADYAAELKRVLFYPGVDELELDFGVSPRAEVAVPSYTFPAELVRLAAATPIELTVSVYMQL